MPFPSPFSLPLVPHVGEGNDNPLQYSCLENPMDGGAWWAAVHGVARSWTRLSDFTLTFHFHALEKEMATHSSVLAWRIPGTGEPGGLPSLGSHGVGHDWSDLAAAAVPHVWWAFSRQWMNSFVPASEWSSGSLHPNNSVWMVCTGEAWAPLQKRFPHPGRAGHVLLGLGSHSCIPVQHYTSLLLVSFPGAVESECGCQEESRKAKEPKHVRPSCSHTHTHLKPQGSEWESQAGRQPTRWATTSVWGLKQQERVFGSSVRLATWGFDLSLHQITSRQMIFCRALQTLGWLHWALGLKTDEYIQDDDLVSGVMGGIASPRSGRG